MAAHPQARATTHYPAPPSAYDTDPCLVPPADDVLRATYAGTMLAQTRRADLRAAATVAELDWRVTDDLPTERCDAATLESHYAAARAAQALREAREHLRRSDARLRRLSSAPPALPPQMTGATGSQPKSGMVSTGTHQGYDLAGRPLPDSHVAPVAVSCTCGGAL